MCADRSQPASFSEPAPAVDATQQIRLSVFAGPGSPTRFGRQQREHHVCKDQPRSPRIYAADGGLMSYGIDAIDLFRRGASYIVAPLGQGGIGRGENAGHIGRIDDLLSDQLVHHSKTSSGKSGRGGTLPTRRWQSWSSRQS
jgi:hypothetical protein